LFVRFDEVLILHSFENDWQAKDAITAWAHVGLDLKEETDDICKFIGVALRDFGVVPFNNFLVKSFHVLCSKGSEVDCI
jgi:sulfur relay (sulfurtransferase) DsrC/TusE family protein